MQDLTLGALGAALMRSPGLRLLFIQKLLTRVFIGLEAKLIGTVPY